MTDKEIIDRISHVRTRNNGLWMQILEIALKHAPSETKGVLQEINANDFIVTGLLKVLAK